jgi:phosphotransferase system HPr-like phosphotransfer protein
MKEAMILLQSIEDVKDFNRIVAVYDGDVDLVSGRYVIDAKSIMGIFSLDLSKPINIQVHGDHPEALLEALKAFIQ